jgi:predicted transcriptional regulator
LEAPLTNGFVKDTFLLWLKFYCHRRTVARSIRQFHDPTGEIRRRRRGASSDVDNYLARSREASTRKLGSPFDEPAHERPLPSRNLKWMEVHFTPEQEAQLAQIAAKFGTNPERLVKDVLARYLDAEARFLAAVKEGLAAAEHGEFIDEKEMDARFERMLHET